MGIITSVLDTVQAEAVKAGASKVTVVSLAVGEMTEAIEDALVFAFEALRELDEYSLCRDAEMHLRMIPCKSECLECGAVYVHDRFHMLCPECGSFAVHLLEGRELQIDSIEVDIDDGEE